MGVGDDSKCFCWYFCIIFPVDGDADEWGACYCSPSIFIIANECLILLSGLSLAYSATPMDKYYG